MSEVQYFSKKLYGYNKKEVVEYIMNLTNQVNDYRKAIMELQVIFEEKTKIADGKDSEIASLNQANRKLSEELEAEKDVFVSLAQENERLSQKHERELAILSDANKKLSEELEAEKNAFVSLTQENESLSQKHERKLATMSDLNKKLFEELKAEKNASIHFRQENERLSQKHERELETLSDANKKLSEELEVEKNALILLTQENGRLSQRLEIELATLSEVNKKLSEELGAEKNAFISLTQENERLSKKHERELAILSEVNKRLLKGIEIEINPNDNFENCKLNERVSNELEKEGNVNNQFICNNEKRSGKPESNEDIPVIDNNAFITHPKLGLHDSNVCNDGSNCELEQVRILPYGLVANNIAEKEENTTTNICEVERPLRESVGNHSDSSYEVKGKNKVLADSYSNFIESWEKLTKTFLDESKTLLKDIEQLDKAIIQDV